MCLINMPGIVLESTIELDLATNLKNEEDW